MSMRASICVSLRRVALHVLPVLMLSSCGGLAGRGAEAILPPEQFWEKARGGALVVDVRTREEFVKGALPGALNIPYDQIGARKAELGAPAKPILLYCRSGRRSGIAAGTLTELGFPEVYNAGGYQELRAAAPRAFPTPSS